MWGMLSEVKTCDKCVAGSIHEDVPLENVCEEGHCQIFTGTHPLQISVDHAMGVEVIEALCDAGQLMGVEGRVGEVQKGAHKRDQILLWVRINISHQVSVGHQL